MPYFNSLGKICRACLYNLTKGRNQRLSQPEAENELGPGHEQLRSQTLEERCDTLVLHHVGNDAETGLGVLKVAVLNTRLDHIERSRYDEGSASTADGGDKVLRPRGFVVVLQTVDVLFGKSRSTEKLRTLARNSAAEKKNIQQMTQGRYERQSSQRHGTVPYPHPRRSSKGHGHGTPRGLFGA